MSVSSPDPTVSTSSIMLVKASFLPSFLPSSLHPFLPSLLPSFISVGRGWGFSKVVATFDHVGRSCNLFMATTGDVRIIPSFRIWDYVLHVEHIACAGWETSARPLVSASENLAGRVENRPGLVECCIGYMRYCPVRASAKKLSQPHVSSRIVANISESSLLISQ